MRYPLMDGAMRTIYLCGFNRGFTSKFPDYYWRRPAKTLTLIMTKMYTLVWAPQWILMIIPYLSDSDEQKWTKTRILTNQNSVLPISRFTSNNFFIKSSFSSKPKIPGFIIFTGTKWILFITKLYSIATPLQSKIELHEECTYFWTATYSYFERYQAC